jgi:preprotein translocase subunit SecF
MAIIIILNVAFAILVVGGMLALLGWGIASDRVVAAKLTERRRAAHARRRQAAPRRAPAYRGGAAFTRGS